MAGNRRPVLGIYPTTPVLEKAVDVFRRRIIRTLSGKTTLQGGNRGNNGGKDEAAAPDR